VIVAIYWAMGSGLLSWEAAVESRIAADEFVARYAVLAYAAYLVSFVVLALALFPAQLWIIVFGAVLFGFWPALIASWLAAIGSAALVFVLARGALAGTYRERAARYLARIETGFQRDQFSWMLSVRFIPIVPYCISNVAPAFLGARFTPFFAAAAIGVIPYVAAYTFAGAKAASVLDSSKPPDVTSLVVDMAPVMLAVAVLPVAALLVRRWRRTGAARKQVVNSE
jgi:uncharacterized membrane protein YdjX (TVP38/TMEM64 family)